MAYETAVMFGVFLIVTALLHKVGVKATKPLVALSFFFTVAVMSGQ